MGRSCSVCRGERRRRRRHDTVTQGALALELGPDHYAMLLQRDFFASFHHAETSVPGQHEVLVCLSVDSRDEVDRLAEAALAAGGAEVREEQGGDFMHGRSFTDPDGHIWELMWMDVEAARSAGAFG